MRLGHRVLRWSAKLLSRPAADVGALAYIEERAEWSFFPFQRAKTQLPISVTLAQVAQIYGRARTPGVCRNLIRVCRVFDDRQRAA